MDRDERSRTGEQASVEEEPVVEVPSVSAAQGESDAALLESGEELQSEAFELMDEDDGLQDRVAGGGRGGPLTADGSPRGPREGAEAPGRARARPHARGGARAPGAAGAAGLHEPDEDRVRPPAAPHEGRAVGLAHGGGARGEPADEGGADARPLLEAPPGRARAPGAPAPGAEQRPFGAPSSAPGGASTEGSPAAPGLGGPR